MPLSQGCGAAECDALGGLGELPRQLAENLEVHRVVAWRVVVEHPEHAVGDERLDRAQMFVQKMVDRRVAT